MEKIDDFQSDFIIFQREKNIEVKVTFRPQYKYIYNCTPACVTPLAIVHLFPVDSNRRRRAAMITDHVSIHDHRMRGNTEIDYGGSNHSEFDEF